MHQILVASCTRTSSVTAVYQTCMLQIIYREGKLKAKQKNRAYLYPLLTPTDVTVWFSVSPDAWKILSHKPTPQITHTCVCTVYVRSDYTHEHLHSGAFLQTKTREEFEKMCRNLKIPVTTALAKHDVVELISRKRGDRDPTVPTLYTGRLADVPKTTSAIANLPVAKLREILHYHGFTIAGNKDQLSLRVYFLRHGETAAVTAREEEQIKDMIQIYKRLVLAERELQLTSHTYRTRTYTTKSYNHFVPPPDNISKENCMSFLRHLSYK